jgi:hypothetical protein
MKWEGNIKMELTDAGFERVKRVRLAQHRVSLVAFCDGYWC